MTQTINDVKLTGMAVRPKIQIDTPVTAGAINQEVKIQAALRHITPKEYWLVSVYKASASKTLRELVRKELGPLFESIEKRYDSR